MEQHFGKTCCPSIRSKKIPVQTHDHMHLSKTHGTSPDTNPVGIRPKIAIMIPNVFWSKFFSEHACRNLEIVFFILFILRRIVINIMRYNCVISNRIGLLKMQNGATDKRLVWMNCGMVAVQKFCGTLLMILQFDASE
jgi:hypothetical protein